MPKHAQRRRAGATAASAASAAGAAEGALRARVNRELYKRNAELAVRNKTLALLRKLDEIALGALSVEEVTHAVAGSIAGELGFELVAIAVLDREDRVLRWLGAASTLAPVTTILKGFPPRALAVSLDLRDHPAVRALKRRAPTFTTDVSGTLPQTLARALAKGKHAAGLGSALVYPLRAGGRALGALVISAARDLANLSRYERESLVGIIGLVAIAVGKAQIYEELQETSADLRLANAQLAQLDKAKSEFLSIASHQLYTPLTALKGYLSMIQEGDFGAVPEKQREVLGILRASSDRLIDLIKNLLDVSRIESGRLELNPVGLDLVQLARDLVTELAPNAQRKKLALAFHAPPSALSKIVADEQRIRQVLLNAVDNAIKYTDQGRVDVSVQRSGEALLFSVTDTGKGISREDARRIFAKFVRVGNAERHHTEGTGLGLYVARQIVREHHGDIWAESPGVGKGSTFYVKLPAEGSREALKPGITITVGIKAAEVGEKA